MRIVLFWNDNETIRLYLIREYLWRQTITTHRFSLLFTDCVAG